MKNLLVSEVFYSIQGEGARAGSPSVFIRLSGCDKTCGFCDTDFASGAEMDIETLRKEIPKSILRTVTNVNGEKDDAWIVWTGGEPTLQLTSEHIAYFKQFGWKQAIETNGAHRVPDGIDWVVCSPKVAEHVLEKSFPNGIDELRYVRHSGQPGIPRPSIKAKRLFLSPMFDGNKINMENLRHCTKLCLQNPEWSLSLQLHKLINVL